MREFATFKDVKSAYKIVTGWKQPWHFEQSGRRQCYTVCGKKVYRVGDKYIVE